MTKTETLGYRGERLFYKACQRRNLPVIWQDRPLKAKLVLINGKLVWDRYRGLKWDFEMGWNKIEVKTSKNWTFNYKKNFPHFDYLVCIHAGKKNRYFIIPRWELPSPQVISGNNSIKAKKWLTIWENRWDLLN